MNDPKASNPAGQGSETERSLFGEILDWVLARLGEVRERYGLPVLVIDYVKPGQRALARQTAERIRALGVEAPASYEAYAALTTIKPVKGSPKALEMVALLVSAQEATARTAREVLPVADAANDQPTLDLLTQRLDIHEKTAWMLRVLLEE